MIRCPKIPIGSALLALLAASSPLEAGRITWKFQVIDSSAAAGQWTSISMAIGKGESFPQVVYEGSQVPSLTGQVVAASAKPTGWKLRSLGPSQQPSTYGSFTRTAAGSDGRVGVVWRRAGTMLGFAQTVDQGWQGSTLATQNAAGTNPLFAPDVAYLSNNHPLIVYPDLSTKLKIAAYNGTSWDVDSPDTGNGQGIVGSMASVAVDSQNQVCLAYRITSPAGIGFACRAAGTGTWTATPIIQTVLYPSSRLSLSLAPNGLPGLTFFSASGALNYGWFDPVSGRWESENLSTSVSGNCAELAFDSQGHPGLAYIGSEGRVHYRTNEGGGWEDIILPDNSPVPVLGTGVALAFDGQDVPVISYFSQSGLVLAYDPVVAPEPATLLLISSGGWVVWRRRR